MLTELLDAAGPDAAAAIERAAALLREGGLVAFPTETVYGLGADATNPQAIEGVFAAKGRPADNPLIVHVRDLEGMERCAVTDERVRALALAFMPGPLTLVLPARDTVPPIARAGLPTVALRVPDHPVALALLERTGPLVAPSANLSGRPSPTTARHVLDDLQGRIAAVLDGGPCRVGIESTVLDLSGERPAILRPGIIGAAEIAEVIGGEGLVPSDEEREEMASATAGPESHAAPRAPGMKYRHYAPGIPVRLVIADEPPQLLLSGALLLTTESRVDFFPGVRTELLSESTLYEQFRRAEEEGVEEIVVYAAPGELSEGLLNRVRKAAEM